MEGTLFEIKTTLMKYAQNLHALTDQVSRLGKGIAEMTAKLGEIDGNLETADRHSTDSSFELPGFVELYTEKRETSALPPALDLSPLAAAVSGPEVKDRANVIPFPVKGLLVSHGGRPITPDSRVEHLPAAAPFLAGPGKPMPRDITDYRPLLQRDGLILLAWDKRITEKGEFFTAYWVTSAGTSRFYASKPLFAEEFALARPHHKSYAAEDGIEFYGQAAPAYMVHVAPELMMNNPLHGKLRKAHIELLKRLGSTVDFDYKYLLSAEKARRVSFNRSRGGNDQRAGA